MRTLVGQLKEKIGQTVTLYLTLDVLRDQKHLQFILAHDKSGTIQLVVSKKTVATHEEISQLLQGSTFIVQGKVVEASQSKTFGLEVQVQSLEVMSKAQPWPITEESAIDLRFDYRVVDLKFPKQQLMLKLRSAFLKGCREYLDSKDFTEISTPKLMSAASESGSQVFKVDYFGKTAYLSQSPQFFKEAGISSGLEAVYEIAPVFRAENSQSSRHLTEFTGLDVEFAWCFEVAEVMQLEEQMMLHALSKLEPFKEEVKSLYGIELTTQPTVKYMTLEEAKAILKEHGVMTLRKEEDLPDHGEREKGTTKSFDLIFKGIEITSGAIRQHKVDVLSEQIVEKGVSLASVAGYLQNFTWGCSPHGGFGLGVDRVIAKLLDLRSIKEAAFMPRDTERLVP